MSVAAIAAAVVGVTGIVVGAVQTGKANKRIKNAMNQRKPYQTPDEIYQLLHATQNKSQGDTITRDFNTNQLDTSFANALGTDELLGAGPNQLSTLFGKKVQGMLEIGSQFHASNMESFGNYMNALKLVGDNKAAEQQSQDNIWKDYMQALAKQKLDANATLNSGINTVVGAAATYGTGQLYKDKSTGGGVTSFGTAGGNAAPSGGGGTGQGG